MKTTLKILAVALILWVVLLTVGVTIAKTDPGTPSQVAKAYFKDQAPLAKKAGAKLVSITCVSTKWWHTFKCNITFVPSNSTKGVCISQYIHTAGRPIAGKVFHEWFPTWACRTKPPTVPKPYPGDPDPRPGA